jgi:ATP-dependent helicase/nuclease subunit B
VCRKDGQVYLRVIDYKSGHTRFDLTSIYYGLQLQLVVYMNAAIELEQRKTGDKVHPAGMYYYHIEDPMLDYEEETDPSRRMLKELAFNGLVNGEKEIAMLQDRELENGSLILPVRLKKDGGYTAASSVATEEEFQKLSRHVGKKLQEYGARILNGDIALNPYELGDEDACSFCSFHSVCGFDHRIEGCQKRRLHPMEKREIWENLEERP